MAIAPQPRTANGVQPLPRGLPGPLRLRVGCTGQGATWSGFQVRKARPASTSGGAGAWNSVGSNGPHCLVTRVCKRHTLSECGSTLLLPRLGVDLSSLSPSRAPEKRKPQPPPSNATRALSHFPHNSSVRLALFLRASYFRKGVIQAQRD